MRDWSALCVEDSERTPIESNGATISMKAPSRGEGLWSLKEPLQEIVQIVGEWEAVKD